MKSLDELLNDGNDLWSITQDKGFTRKQKIAARRRAKALGKVYYVGFGYCSEEDAENGSFRDCGIATPDFIKSIGFAVVKTGYSLNAAFTKLGYGNKAVGIGRYLTTI
jgi:hypothetical protein